MLIKKLKGDQQPLPPRANNRSIAVAALGGALAIGVLGGFGLLLENAVLLGSLGATCVLLFGFPDAPFSQPRNILLGHVISSFIGLSLVSIFGYHVWVLALALAFAIAAMMFTRTVHPPAGSNPVIIFLLHPTWVFLIFPTLLGALLVLVVGLLYLNVARSEKYPKYWF
jgi:CBS-domain-containing membrane protein